MLLISRGPPTPATECVLPLAWGGAFQMARATASPLMPKGEFADLASINGPPWMGELLAARE